MEKEGYKLKQINVAAFLFASGLKLVNTVRINNEVFFIFSPKSEAEQLVNNYFAGNATINPRELFARLNDLRDIVFSGNGR